MTDINEHDCYNLDFFWDIRDKFETDNIPIELRNIITSIINSHYCFNKSYVYNPHQYNKSHYSIQQHNHNFPKQYNYNKIQSINKCSIPKTIIKKNNDKITITTISNLNKLSTDNYDKLSIDIINNINNDNYNKIIDKLFEISFKQSNYSELYVSLICSIINKSSNETKTNELNSNIYNHLYNIIDDIIFNRNDDLDILLTIIDKGSMDYDDFCDINKLTKYFLGKILIICMIVSNDRIFTKSHSSNIITEINNILIKYKNYDNELFLNVCQIMNNTIKLDTKFMNDLNSYLHKRLNGDNFDKSKNIKFKLYDIIDNKQWKRL